MMATTTFELADRSVVTGEIEHVDRLGVHLRDAVRRSGQASVERCGKLTVAPDAVYLPRLVGAFLGRLVGEQVRVTVDRGSHSMIGTLRSVGPCVELITASGGVYALRLDRVTGARRWP